MFWWMGEELSNEDGSIDKTFGRGVGVVKLLRRIQKSGDGRNAICLLYISIMRHHCKASDSPEPHSKEGIGMQ